MNELPERSSGEPWTAEEEERLYNEVKALTAKFPGRSVSAVITRIALKSAWWSKQNHRKKS